MIEAAIEVGIPIASIDGEPFVACISGYVSNDVLFYGGDLGVMSLCWPVCVGKADFVLGETKNQVDVVSPKAGGCTYVWV